MGWLGGCVPNKKRTYLQETTPGIEVDGIRYLKEQEFTYRLKPNDILSIKITSVSPKDQNFFTTAEDSGDPLLSGYIVDTKGNIELIYVGSVCVGGLSIPEARDKIKEIASKYLDSPSVHIKLVSFHFTVLGEVGNQGKFTSYNPRTTVLEAIGMAGGLTDFAERSKIKIIRSEIDTTKIFYVNVLDEKFITSEFYYLQPNDVIAVSALPTKDYRQNQAANIALGLSSLSLLLLMYFRFLN
ncbi:polysaccharide biosynthesis/export family protein [soil metagenome]